MSERIEECIVVLGVQVLAAQGDTADFVIGDARIEMDGYGI